MKWNGSGPTISLYKLGINSLAGYQIIFVCMYRSGVLSEPPTRLDSRAPNYRCGGGARSQVLLLNKRLIPLLVSDRTILPAAIVLDSEELLPRAYRGRRRYGSCLGGGPQGYAYASGRRGTRAGNSG
ncbi:hypothetical protein SUGI_1424790 [Cryptomeria japonica]|nr:hypothetical protein SUGI_1424790 [Cryptomeria japonica]